MACVRVISNGRQIDCRELSEALLIGRGEECDLRLTGTQVSRQHCRIERAPEGWIAIDLGSRNGTLAGGRRLTRKPLGQRDVLQIGSFVLQFEAAACRTIDDEVLEVLNVVAPSGPIVEALGADQDPEDADLKEETGAGMRTEAGAADKPTDAVAQKPSAAAAEKPSAARGRRPPASLWGKASVAAPAKRSPEKNSAGRKKQPAGRKKHSDQKTPRFRERLRDMLARLVRSVQPPEAPHEGPWYRRRISLPIAIAATLIVALCLFWLTGGISFGGKSSGPIPKILPHSSAHNRD